MRLSALALSIVFFSHAFPVQARADEIPLLPRTKPLTLTGDLSAQMLTGIDKFLSRETDQSISNRSKFWHPDFSSPAAYEKSIETNRSRLRKIIGAVDPRITSPSFEIQTNLSDSGAFTIHAVQWPVLDGVHGEGLLLRPKSPPLARIIAIPDADQIPETLAGLAPGLPAER